MKYKQEPRDFIVEEIIDLPQEKGKYLYIKLIKKNWNTLDIINKLKDILKIKRSYIGFAGTKDKKAITTQYISIKNITKEKINKIKIKDIILEPLHQGNKPISLGDHKANKFKIKLDVKPIKLSFITNYFGEQRFSQNNVNIGLALLKKDYKTATGLIYNKEIKTTDYVKEIKKQDKKLISLYINSVQSYLWNNVAENHIEQYKPINHFLKKQPENITIPLMAFDTEFENKKIKELYQEELNKINLQQKDFITRTFPDSLPTTSDRQLFVKLKDFKITNNTLEFTLPKGSYATIVLKKLETFLRTNN